MRSIAAIAMACVLFLMAGAAARADLVTNGGFESGSLSNWSAGAWFIDNSQPHSGSFNAIIGCFDASCLTNSADALSQTISDTVGTTYTLSFSFNSGNGVPGSDVFLHVELNNSDLYDETFAQALSYADRSVTFTGSGSDTLAFFVENDTGASFVDDISVVPEPASLSLFGAAVVGLGLRRRRSKR